MECSKRGSTHSSKSTKAKAQKQKGGRGRGGEGREGEEGVEGEGGEEGGEGRTSHYSLPQVVALAFVPVYTITLPLSIFITNQLVCLASRNQCLQYWVVASKGNHCTIHRVYIIIIVV
jgi:hypothetical protein